MSPAPGHAVFLQGMPSSFFRRVGECLAGQGWRVTRINLSAGDWLFWHDARAASYRGRPGDWPAHLRRFFLEQAVTDLVLLGAYRHYHREAVALARELGIRVTVTDFGYFRPDWILLERLGPAGVPEFPRDPERLRGLARGGPAPDLAPRFADSALRMAVGDLAQNFAPLLFRPFYPHYRRSDRRPHPVPYTLASGWRLLGNRLRRGRTHRQAAALHQDGRPYYLFPLQLAFDFQMVTGSPFRDMAEAIERVLVSFARHAPPASWLVLKEHPWDPGLPDWERHVRKRARALGLDGRIRYLRGGDLEALIAGAQGVVLVNSTVGLRVLQGNRPLKALGRAIFDVPGLACQEDLDAFWTEGRPPDPELRDGFFRALAATVQVRGVFFREPGLSEAVRATCQRLAEPDSAPADAAGREDVA